MNEILISSVRPHIPPSHLHRPPIRSGTFPSPVPLFKRGPGGRDVLSSAMYTILAFSPLSRDSGWGAFYFAFFPPCIALIDE